MEVPSWAASTGPTTVGPGCEQVGDGVLQEPVAALTSLAFLVAGLVIALAARRRATSTAPARDDDRRATGTGRPRPLGYAALVAGVGVGSFVQHGPDPAWSDPAHDLPLLATLTYLGADAVADLTGRPRAWWWWSLPVAALAPLVVATPRLGDLAQVGVAGVAVGLAVLRAVAHPALRRRIGAAVALLVVGSAVGTLSRAGWPWCDPTSALQGHGLWHVLAATALAVLGPTVGRVRPPVGTSGDGRRRSLTRPRTPRPARRQP